MASMLQPKSVILTWIAITLAAILLKVNGGRISANTTKLLRFHTESTNDGKVCFGDVTGFD